MAEPPQQPLLPKNNPVKRISNGQLSHDAGGFTEVLSFCRQATQQESCPSLSHRGKRQKTNCTCLHALRPTDGEDPLVLLMMASFICYFGSLDNDNRRLLEIEWIKGAIRAQRSGTSGKYYHVNIMSRERFLSTPLSDAEKNAQKEVHEPLVCVNAFRLLLGLGADRFGSSRKHAVENTIAIHGLKGKTGADSNKTTGDIVEAEASVRSFLEDLKGEATAPATRVTRQLAGDTLRHEEEGLVELPHHYSKRSLYHRWAFERGWKITKDAVGREKKTPRPRTGGERNAKRKNRSIRTDESTRKRAGKRGARRGDKC